MKLSFKQRVLILAVALVIATQAVTLFAVLGIIRRDADERARVTVGIGGAVFRDFMKNRVEQLRTTVGVLAQDFGFKQAAATADAETIRSALANQSARVGADIALLLDLEGGVMASSGGSTSFGESRELATLAAAVSEQSIGDSVIYLGGVPYQAVIVPLRAPAPIAWVVMGFQLDRVLAERIKALSGLDVSIVRMVNRHPSVLTSTLPVGALRAAVAPLTPLQFARRELVVPETNDGYLTLLQPFMQNSDDVAVALQLSMERVNASYRNVRDLLLLMISASLLLAVAGSAWLARTVTQPLSNLVAAVRRLRKGVYTEPIRVGSSDEFGDLAGAFNAMQEAIAERAERIHFQAHHDSLSLLPNRHLLLQRLSEAVSQSESLNVLSIGIDRFGRIVSSLGHRAGDELIRRVAHLIRNSLAEGELLAHLGGNEFVVVLPDADSERAARWVERLGQVLHTGVRLDEANISLRATIGGAQFPEHSRDPTELLRRASIAKSTAQARRERFAVYRPGQEEQHLKQIRIVGDLARAIRNDELKVFFQPKIDCASREVRGAEALVRWQHPELGLLMPGAFVDAIEQAGGIAHLTRWVIREAIAYCADWQQRGGFGLSLSLNLSVDDLLDQYLPYYLLQVVQERRLAASLVTLEVTESAIMTHVAEALSTLQCIRELGFKVSIDDFGTGQSSLAQLKRMPLDELKIDKAFIMNMNGERDEAIVRTIVQLGKFLELNVVAEGVEDAAVLRCLAELGCDDAQGYYISKPIAADAFHEWLRQWQKAPDSAALRGGMSAFGG